MLFPRNVTIAISIHERHPLLNHLIDVRIIGGLSTIEANIIATPLPDVVINIGDRCCESVAFVSYGNVH